MRLGLVGFGPWGRKLFDTLRRDLPDVELAWVCTRNGLDEERSGLLAEAGVRHLTHHWRHVLSVHQADAVVIATAPATQSLILRECIWQGAHAFVEKPVATSVEDVEAIVQLLCHHRHKSCVLVDYTHLFSPAWQALKRLPLSVGHINSFAGGLGPFRDVSALWDWGTHDAAMLLDFLAAHPHAPLTLSGASRESACTRDGKCGSSWRFGLSCKTPAQSHHVATIAVSNLEVKRRRFEVWSEDGEICWVYDGTHVLRRLNRGGVVMEAVECDPTPPLTIALREFVAYCQDPTRQGLVPSGLGLTLDVTQLLASVERATM